MEFIKQHLWAKIVYVTYAAICGAAFMYVLIAGSNANTNSDFRFDDVGTLMVSVLIGTLIGYIATFSVLKERIHFATELKPLKKNNNFICKCPYHPPINISYKTAPPENPAAVKV